MKGQVERRKVISIVETILLADAEPATRQAMKSILELNGYRVVEAHHGIEALQVLQEWGDAVQLALCAADLPDMTGAEWLAQADYLEPGTPALLLSESESVAVAEMPVSSFAGMPTKPPAPARLLERIRAVLDEHFFARCERTAA